MASDGTIPAGPWASQYVVTSINAPILAGYGIFQIVFGIFLGESVRLWRRPNLPYTRRYRMFLLVVTVLLVFYALFTIEEVCFWGVSQKRSAEAFFNGTVTSQVAPLLGNLVAALCQGALAFRASALFVTPLRRWIFLGAIGLAIAAEYFAGALMFTVAGILFIEGKGSALGGFTINAALAITLCMAAAIDLAITVALYTHLRVLKKRGQGFNQSTDSAIRRLINLALRTAAYTTLLALVGAGLALGIKPTDFRRVNIVFAFYIPLPGLYALALFTTVGSRSATGEQGGEGKGMMMPTTLTLPSGGVEGIVLPLPTTTYTHAPVSPKPRPRPDSLFGDDDEGEGEGEGEAEAEQPGEKRV